MHKLTVTLVLGVAAIFTAGASFAADRISDFSLIDYQGKFHQLSRYVDHDAVVLFSHVRGDRDSRRALQDFNELTLEFADGDIAFFVLDSSGKTDKSVLIRDSERNDVEVPVLIDDTRLVAKQLGLGNAAEVVILDPERRENVFKGVINNRFAAEGRSRRASEHYAADALRQVLSGDQPDAPTLASGADAIEFDLDAGISYAEDIVPILERRCVSCHTEGGIAPFAMSNHQVVQGWSPMIREVLYTKRMPPGQIDNDYVHEFKDVSHITIAETRALVQWIDEGARFDGGKDPFARIAPRICQMELRRSRPGIADSSPTDSRDRRSGLSQSDHTVTHRRRHLGESGGIRSRRPDRAAPYHRFRLWP